MNRALLEQEFSPEQIKQREGSFGKTLNYLPTYAVIARMNEAFDGIWSFDILSHEILESEVVVLGRLSAEGISKTQFGASRITKHRDTGLPVSIADDLKSAASDAIKKCATLAGCGLHLYQDKSTGQQSTTSNVIPMNNPAQAAIGPTRLTAKQHAYIQRLANEQGLTKKELNNRCQEVYGVVSDHLTKDQASSCIEQMLA